MSNQHLSAEAEIRTSIDNWAKAIRATELDQILVHYAPDIVAYDAIMQLQFRGFDAYKKHWIYCLTMCPPGQMIFDIEDLTIHAAQDVGFSYSLSRCGGRDDKGEEKSSWMRNTRCYRKINNRWLVVHEHFSSPFDMDSGKMLFDAKP